MATNYKMIYILSNDTPYTHLFSAHTYTGWRCWQHSVGSFEPLQSYTLPPHSSNTAVRTSLSGADTKRTLIKAAPKLQRPSMLEFPHDSPRGSIPVIHVPL